jgi:DNA-binding FadR family transcriptional regulator
MERASTVVEMTLHDLEFHRGIARATLNDVYLVLHDALGGALIEVRTSTLASGNAREASRAHRDIAQHIANRDAEAARAAMKDHLDSVWRAWTALGA